MTKKESEKDEMANEKTEEMKEDVQVNINQDKIEAAKDEQKEGMKEEGENNKEEMASVMMEEAMNINPMSEEKVIQEEMKKIKEKKGSMLSLQRNTRSVELPRSKLGPYFDKSDVSSSLSGNNLVIKNAKSKKISQILVFNAMYFKGNWAVPFTRQKIDSFYKSDSEKSTVTMMGTQGTFRAGSIPDLDSVAIELPYQDDRYSLLIVRPNSRTGLRQLISDLTGYPLRNIQNYLKPQEVEVCIPSFEIQTTSNPVEALSKFGVTDVFNQEKADLTGISKTSGLFVEELVQYVTVKVDEGSSSYNYMTASNPATRTEVSKFAADSPFLYFVRDTKDDIIIVAGKVVDPSAIPGSP
ncbi:hypothetical protein L9F63_004180 [Diploptera punctata]|uniref:Serpin domain-containing protein n=1 Tax=Diploptera punctata TaxID=6984 RepID=A0AAD7ZHU1_DIPPU|nr:hypothetical protein L9F63_004180 [Diploptera punctata]